MRGARSPVESSEGEVQFAEHTKVMVLPEAVTFPAVVAQARAVAVAFSAEPAWMVVLLRPMPNIRIPP